MRRFFVVSAVLGVMVTAAPTAQAAPPQRPGPSADIRPVVWFPPYDVARKPVVGTTVNAEVVVGNDGPSDAEDARVTVSLPPNLAFATAQRCQIEGSEAFCSLGRIPSGYSTTVRVGIEAIDPGPATVVAEATSASPDPYRWNDTDASTITVLDPTWVDVSIIGRTISTLAWDLELSNGGPGPATEVVVEVENARLMASAPGGSCEVGGARCTIPSIAVGERAVIPAVVVDPTRVVRASARPREIDHDPADNETTMSHSGRLPV